MGRPRKQSLNVLVAEDDANDIVLLETIMIRDGIHAHLNIVPDGTEVIDYLRGRGHFANRAAFPMPDLIVLDLKMTTMSGLEVLEWRRKHPDCARIPVVILSGSGLEKDIERAYALGANTYFEKPNSFAEFKTLLQTLVQYWSTSKRPLHPEQC